MLILSSPSPTHRSPATSIVEWQLLMPCRFVLPKADYSRLHCQTQKHTRVECVVVPMANDAIQCLTARHSWFDVQRSTKNRTGNQSVGPRWNGMLLLLLFYQWELILYGVGRCCGILTFCHVRRRHTATDALVCLSFFLSCLLSSYLTSPL